MLTYLQAQELINANPDPNGDPWIVGGYGYNGDDKGWIYDIEQVPLFILTPESQITTLPDMVDNRQYQFMRPIFNQSDVENENNYGSCAQASGVGYVFTYEINRLKNVSSLPDENVFAHHYSWNYLNEGKKHIGSYMWHGWKILKHTGCPNLIT